MNVPSGGVTFLVVFAAALVYFAISFARTGRTSVPETKDREVRWVEGRARILDVKIVERGSGSHRPQHLHLSQRLRRRENRRWA